MTLNLETCIVILLASMGSFICGGFMSSSSTPTPPPTHLQSVEEAIVTVKTSMTHELFNNDDLKQAQLSSLSGYLCAITEIEYDWLSLEIVNNKKYKHLRKDYYTIRAYWDEQIKAYNEEPSEYESGTMEMLDRKMRHYTLRVQCVDALNALFNK